MQSHSRTIVGKDLGTEIKVSAQIIDLATYTTW